MALRTCRECGAKVRVRDDICENCGVHFPAAINPITVLGKSGDALENFARRGAFALIVVVLFGIVFIGTLFLG